MPNRWTPDKINDLAARRGRAAGAWYNPDNKRKFIAAQGEGEDRGRTSWWPWRKGLTDTEYDDMDAETKRAEDAASAGKFVDLDRSSAADIFKGQTEPKKYGPSFKRGTPFVPRTGPALLHRGEAVIPRKQATAMRKQKPSAFFGE